MAESNLNIYLNDHLAGAAGVIRHLDRLSSMVSDADIGADLRTLRAEISHDRDILVNLMNSLGVGQSTFRKLASSLAQKASILKFWETRTSRDHLRELQGLDLLSPGIEGKRSLWTALASASEVDTRLGQVDYGAMTRRAGEQLELVSTLRKRIAKLALPE